MTVDRTLQQAIAQQQVGHLQEAGELYLTILQDDPQHAEANHNMGVLAVQMQQPAASLPYFAAALDVDPTRSRYWLNYIDALFQAGQTTDARQVLALARQQGLDGDEVDALVARADVERPLEDQSLQRGLEIPDPQEVSELIALFTAGQYAEAAARAQSLTVRFPLDGTGWKVLGAVFQHMRRDKEALAHLQKAVALSPGDPDTHHCLANTLADLGRLNEAEASFRDTLRIKPNYAEAYNNLGSTLYALRRFDEAIACYQLALKLKPELAEVHNNLGTALKDAGRIAESVACCRRALEIAPDYAVAHQNLANQLAHLSDFDQVPTESNTALRLQPNSALIWEQHLYTFSYHPDLTAAQIYAEFVRWGDRFPDRVVDFSNHDRTPGRRLRIGFVSPDFRRHSSRVYFWPMFANHDPAVVELFAYSNVKTEDDATQKFKGLFAHWRNIRGVADHEVAELIRQDKIDILVDGCNHMLDDRLGVFTLKPAPIQATWLGAAWTTGLKMIDYVIFDPYIAPEGTLARESIVRLPRCFIAYSPLDATADVAPTPALKNGYITFGYTGRTERLNHHTFRVWGEILRRIPTARLILDYRAFDDPLTQNHYRQFMLKHGMDPRRVTMRRSTDIFAGLNDIDVLLDSFPHSGGTMLLDALWMAVPVLTLSGRPPLGRIGTTFMTNLGLPEWVARSHDDYINKACALTQDVQALAQLRDGMRKRMQNSPLMDGPGFARDMERVYCEMYEKWASVAPPERLTKNTDQHQLGNPTPAEVSTLLSLLDQRHHTEAHSLANVMTRRFPLHGLGWMVLGVVLNHWGRSADALMPLQQAVALSPGNADVHLNLGVAFKSLGRLEEAAFCYRQALTINPALAEAFYNLGNTLKDLGRLDEAADNYRRALHIVPDNAMIHNNFGAVLQDLGRSDQAALSYQRALNIDPNFADAHYNLGITLQKLDRWHEAETCYRRALDLKPAFTDALNSLASLLHLQGESMQALNIVMQSLRINAAAETQRIFVACVNRLSFTQADDEVRTALARALTEPWGRPSELARTSIDLIKLNPDIAAYVAGATSDSPQRISAHALYENNSLTPIAADPLMRALLESTPVCDVALERFLTAARHQLLETAVSNCALQSSPEPGLTFYCALARQCFINEYVFSYTDDEFEIASNLRNSLTEALAAQMPVPVLWLVAVASYFPLYSLALASRLLGSKWPETVSAVLVQQIREPTEELQLRGTLPKLTNIEDLVSLRVQSQYEDNPYPRWVKTVPAGAAGPFSEYLRQKFPLVSFEYQADPARTEFLIAGCGTGLHPIATAQRIQGAQILAVDLSLSSLSYAKRKALETGLLSIEFAQADLLKFGELERTFDVIECSGVLHHLADPWAGWRALLSLLRPGGFMRLGFYSALARRDVVRIRNHIADQGYGSAPAEIRRFRQALMVNGPSGQFGTILTSPDFFSTSTCRDLLFHVQEHRLTLDEIRVFLGENQLKFLGFEIENRVLQAYCLRFPEDRAAINLEQWQIFENENPDTFGTMYQFWIQQ